MVSSSASGIENLLELVSEADMAESEQLLLLLPNPALEGLIPEYAASSMTMTRSLKSVNATSMTLGKRRAPLSGAPVPRAGTRKHNPDS